MKSNSLKFLLSFGLFLLPAAVLHAELDSVLKLNVNCYYQSKETTSDKAVTGKVKTVRFNAKQLLREIGKENGVKFPSGSILMVNDAGTVFVADSKRTFITDASDYVQIVFERDEELFNGRLNLTNGKENSRTYYPLSLKITLANIQGTVRGIAIENRFTGAPKKTGIQFTRGNTESGLSGKGTVNGGIGYYEGDLKLKGKTASPL